MIGQILKTPSATYVVYAIINGKPKMAKVIESPTTNQRLTEHA